MLQPSCRRMRRTTEPWTFEREHHDQHHPHPPAARRNRRRMLLGFRRHDLRPGTEPGRGPCPEHGPDRQRPLVRGLRDHAGQLPRRRHGGRLGVGPAHGPERQGRLRGADREDRGPQRDGPHPVGGPDGLRDDGRLPLQGSRRGRADRLQPGPHDEEGQRLLGRHDREAGQPAVQGPPRSTVPGVHGKVQKATSPGPPRPRPGCRRCCRCTAASSAPRTSFPCQA